MMIIKINHTLDFIKNGVVLSGYFIILQINKLFCFLNRMIRLHFLIIEYPINNKRDLERIVYLCSSYS